MIRGERKKAASLRSMLAGIVVLCMEPRARSRYQALSPRRGCPGIVRRSKARGNRLLEG